MREARLVESSRSVIALSDAEASALEIVGRRLASSRGWWGSEDLNDTDTRSVVEVTRLDAGYWQVMFREVVGLVRVGEIQITVDPKIPTPHFTYLALKSGLVPRLDTEDVYVARGKDLLEILALWALEAAERLLRLGLRKGYAEYRDEADSVRGRLLVQETANAFFQGRPKIIAEFEELDSDTPLNRLIRAAIEHVSRMPFLDLALRKRAMRIATRFDGVGPLQMSDLRVRQDRQTSHYSQAVALARTLLLAGGISTSRGDTTGTAYLIRSPELIEEGIRKVLEESIPECKIEKRKRYLGDSGISLNPDLVFDNGFAVGDVKYKFFGKDWNRSDLYQAVTFGTGFRSHRAVIVGFLAPGETLPSSLPVGDLTVSAIAWNADTDIRPNDAAAHLVEAARGWLTD